MFQGLRRRWSAFCSEGFHFLGIESVTLGGQATGFGSPQISQGLGDVLATARLALAGLSIGIGQ